MFEQIEFLEIIFAVLSILAGIATFSFLQNRSEMNDHLFEMYLRERDIILHEILLNKQENGDKFKATEDYMPPFNEWKKRHGI